MQRARHCIKKKLHRKANRRQIRECARAIEMESKQSQNYANTMHVTVQMALIQWLQKKCPEKSGRNRHRINNEQNTESSTMEILKYAIE